ncbi:MAG: DUF29 domain-containing protein [Cyanobacteria bacterium SW_9_44_58]|nr:MAG: DUF29 domain-containing protein [Cyanobacteria bacterium SW_9_44_58]
MRSIPSTPLYEKDFALWIEETVANLEARDTSHLDWQHLIEEIEGLGKSQRKAVRSYLLRLLEHLLKRCYVNLPECYRSWEIEIRNFRRELKQELKESPSLNGFILDITDESYEDAKQAMQEDYPTVTFPERFPFPREVETLLTSKFWQDDNFS